MLEILEYIDHVEIWELIACTKLRFLLGGLSSTERHTFDRIDGVQRIRHRLNYLRVEPLRSIRGTPVQFRVLRRKQPILAGVKLSCHYNVIIILISNLNI